MVSFFAPEETSNHTPGGQLPRCLKRSDKRTRERRPIRFFLALRTCAPWGARVQALTVEFVNNREKTTAKGAHYAHNVMGVITTATLLFFCLFLLVGTSNYRAAVAMCTGCKRLKPFDFSGLTNRTGQALTRLTTQACGCPRALVARGLLVVYLQAVCSGTRAARPRRWPAGDDAHHGAWGVSRAVRS